MRPLTRLPYLEGDLGLLGGYLQVPGGVDPVPLDAVSVPWLPNSVSLPLSLLPVQPVRSLYLSGLYSRS